MNNGDVLKKYAYGNHGQVAEDLQANGSDAERTRNTYENYEQGDAPATDSSTASARQVAGILFDVLKRKKLAVIILLIIIAGGYGVYGKYFNLTDEEKARKELGAAVEAVGKLMVLPEGDEPVLATVTDAETLIKQQAFFSGSVNGDQLLLFPKNMKAVIYSPSRKVIVNAGPIEQQAPIQNQESQPSQNASADEARITNQELQTQNSPVLLKIAFYNGTKTVGLANDTEMKLKEVFPNFETVMKANAGNKDYKETIVVDLTGGTKSVEAQSIASALNAKVGSFPNDEMRPDADILIIAGGR